MTVVRQASVRVLSFVLATALALVGIVPALPAPAAAAPAPPPAAPRPETRTASNAVVRWAPGVPRAQIAAAADRLGFRIVRDSAEIGWTLVAPTKPGVTPRELVASLRANRLIAKGDVEHIYSTEGLPAPNDPLFVGQWGLYNSGQTGGTPGADISARRAWTRTTGSKDVVVAVVDTGMDYTHPDLRDNIWTNPGEIPGNGIDDDGNGYADDVHGYDFGDRDASVYDPEQGDQHATHVAGIIGADGDNGRGVSGVNWDVTIMPVKFLVYGSGTDFDGAEAIHYAVDNGADIINCSWGGSESSDVLDEAIAYAAAHDVLVVTAAGNDGTDVDDMAFYPGCIDSTAIVNVAATDDDDKLAEFSNYGSEVDLAAPGVDVTSTMTYDCAGMFIDSFPYRVELFGFPVESVAPEATRRALVSGAMMQLAPLTESVLVVDDSTPEEMNEEAGERLDTYVGDLHAAGYSDVTTWSTEVQGTPSFAAMDGRTVVWFTGARISPFFEPMITAEDRAVLGTFLDAGGRLMFSSGDAVFDLIWWDPEWLFSYLHVFPGDVSALGFDLKGFADTPFEGLAGSLPADLGEASSDWLTPWDDVPQPMIGLGGYATMSGTSMAAPHVTGAAALLKAAFPSASAEELRDRLLDTVDAKASLSDVTVQGGRLNAWAAMQAFPGRPWVTAPADDDVLRGGRDETLAWTVSPHASAQATFEAELGLPVSAFAEGFEGGDLGLFATDGSWTTTSAASEGAFGAASDGGPDLGSMWTDVTVPEGGGDLSFSFRYEGDPWMSAGFVSVDTTDNVVWYTEMPTQGWRRATVGLPEGEHTLIFSLVDYDPEATTHASLGVDDVRLDGFDMQPLLTAPAGASSAVFTAPYVDVPAAKLRMRSHLGAMTSGWSEMVDVRISTDATPPTEPGDLVAVPGTDGDANLSWTNPSAGEGAIVRVLRRVGAAPVGPRDASATVVYEGDALSVHDTGMRDGDVARYAAYAVDPAENVSAAATATAAIVDQTAPSAVTRFQAGLQSGVVHLAWMRPASCSAVRVLRRTDTTPTGPDDPDATVVYDGPGSSAVDFMLTRHVFNGTAYYAAFPRDPSGNTGPRSAVSLFVARTGMIGSFKLNGGASYCTSTTVVASSDVPTAVRTRFDQGSGYGAWQAYAASTTLTLEPPIDGLHVVKAQYESPEGLRVELTAQIVLELAPPSAPTALKAEGLNRRTKLTWTPSKSSDVTTCTVYRSASASGPFTRYASIPSFVSAYVVKAADAAGFFALKATDLAGMESTFSAVVAGAPGEGVTRVAGADRYETAVQVSRRHFASAETVVLATGENFADALSASGLAGSYDAPILLTKRASLPATVSAEIARLKAKRVLVIGSPSAISTAVASSLEASYTVRRIQGADRYGTAAAVARAIDAHETTAPVEVAVVNGSSFADGVAVSAAAYALHMPVLLTKAYSLPNVTEETVNWLGSADEHGEGLQVYVIGGEPSISYEVQDQLGGEMTMRLDGSNRYETAAFVNTYFSWSGLIGTSYVGVASGRTFPDALTGGAAAGKEGGFLLLTEPGYPVPDLQGIVRMETTSIDRCEVFGSAKTISDNVKSKLQGYLDAGGWVMPEFPFPELPPDEPGVW